MDDETSRRKKIFYEDFADGVFKFSCDQTLKFQRAMLAEKSLVFHKLFMDSSSSDQVIEMTDYDFATFKLFLDCVMTFQDCSVIDALLLFPMAWKYETKEFINECLYILEPKELNENVCITLNLALCCKCEELQKYVVDFLKNKGLIYKIFDEEQFYSTLEPESVYELLQYIKIDSYVIQIIFKWGNSYLQKHNKSVALKTFFLQNGIIQFLEISSFETTQALFDFNESELGKDFYSISDVLNHFKNLGNEVDNRNCSWFNVKAGECITEKFVYKNFALFSDHNISINIFLNPLICYKYPESNRKEAVIYNYDYKIIDSNGKQIKTGSEEFYDHKDVLGDNKCTWTINNTHNCISNLKFEAKFTFNYDCRILKRSPKNFDVTEPNPENLYINDFLKINLIKQPELDPDLLFDFDFH